MVKNKKIKVKLEAWYAEDETLLEYFKEVFSYNKCIDNDKEIEFTTSSHFDFLVVFNRSYSLFFPERTLIYPMEPLWSSHDSKDNYYRSKNIFVADYRLYPTSSAYSERFFTMNCTTSPLRTTIKTKNISMVVAFDERGETISYKSDYFLVLYNFRVKLAIKLAEISSEFKGGGGRYFWSKLDSRWQ